MQFSCFYSAWWKKLPCLSLGLFCIFFALEKMWKGNCHQNIVVFPIWGVVSWSMSPCPWRPFVHHVYHLCTKTNATGKFIWYNPLLWLPDPSYSCGGSVNIYAIVRIIFMVALTAFTLHCGCAEELFKNPFPPRVILFGCSLLLMAVINDPGT